MIEYIILKNIFAIDKFQIKIHQTETSEIKI